VVADGGDGLDERGLADTILGENREVLVGDAGLGGVVGGLVFQFVAAGEVEGWVLAGGLDRGVGLPEGGQRGDELGAVANRLEARTNSVAIVRPARARSVNNN